MNEYEYEKNKREDEMRQYKFEISKLKTELNNKSNKERELQLYIGKIQS